jgi:hypothetical protein
MILRTVFLIFAGFCFFGMLSAVFEKLRMRKLAARSLAAGCLILAAYTHTWLWLLGFTVFAVLFVVVLLSRQKTTTQ